MIRDIDVFGFLVNSIGMKVNTVVADEGIYTLIKGDGVEVKIDLGKAERDDPMKVYGEHLEKINGVIGNFGSEEEITLEEYLTCIVHQTLGYVSKNKKIVEQKNKEVLNRKGDVFSKFDKR